MKIKYKLLGELFWSLNATTLHRPGLLNQNTVFYVLNPVTMTNLGYDKTSVISASAIESNFRQAFSSDVNITGASDYLQTNWASNGWTTSYLGAFVAELNDFAVNNFTSGNVNVNLTDYNILLLFGSVGGQSYAVPMFYQGNGPTVTYNPMFINATGGTVTTNGNFRIHTFNSSSTFQITAGSGFVDVLVVGGGGGGGGQLAGGGGGGGVIYHTSLGYGVGTYPVTVGLGGSSDANGADSVFDIYTAKGGGYGGNNNSPTAGNTGGSGGGAAWIGAAGGSSAAAGNGTASQGNSGGLAKFGNGYYPGGGGGGAGGAGGTAVDNGGVGGSAGAGGVGQPCAITGSTVYYGGGGGGGGGGGTGAIQGAGGNGGGGNGGLYPNAGSNGTANTGGGGGGSGTTSPGGGGHGGSGVVIIRYRYQ